MALRLSPSHLWRCVFHALIHAGPQTDRVPRVPNGQHRLRVLQCLCANEQPRRPAHLQSAWSSGRLQSASLFQHASAALTWHQFDYLPFLIARASPQAFPTPPLVRLILSLWLGSAHPSKCCCCDGVPECLTSMRVSESSREPTTRIVKARNACSIAPRFFCFSRAASVISLNDEPAD